MIDHFRWLAPIYDHFVTPPDPAYLRDLLRLPTDGALLDVGGGTGRVSAQLRPLVGRLVLTDPSRAMLNRAPAGEPLWPVQGVAERLPLPAASFDRVLVVDALHHFVNQSRAIVELLRVLKPGGRLVIEEPDIRRWPVKLVALAEKLALMQSHFYSASEIQAMIGSQARQSRIEYDGRFTSWVVADK